jgi:hypothetical protein
MIPPSKLTELLKSHERIFTDSQKMRADLGRIESEEKAIFAAGLVDDASLEKLTKGRALREMVLRRLPDCESMARTLDQQIGVELASAADELNGAVQKAIAVKRSEIEQALRPFFTGAMRQAKELAGQLFCPAIQEIQSAFFHRWSSCEPGLDFHAQEAKYFIDHAQRAERKFKI